MSIIVEILERNRNRFPILLNEERLGLIRYVSEKIHSINPLSLIVGILSANIANAVLEYKLGKFK